MDSFNERLSNYGIEVAVQTLFDSDEREADHAYWCEPNREFLNAAESWLTRMMMVRKKKKVRLMKADSDIISSVKAGH